ncbi:hypothetical protein RSOL_179310 [Rhizoctonia solani AG-3 Rhs1AP]|uniref:Uncharacterized protein n=2 Tax=Rhizoctonia solani AG-3 TaxID=1086053 RepID=A0A074S5Z3_9AGAM|nr:hypothetical protein RSOL_179310 [Rhizoctonia solani AG-3 Rhs1AP]KEP52243.1 hypothetical protein V565_048290 [Rhizoctonia solani 123E]
MARAGPVDGIFNALFLMKRKYISLKFREPQRMELNSAWGKGNQLFEWYYGLNNHIIDTIQLRKEREPPLYHEYFAFRLRSDAGSGIGRFPTIIRRMHLDFQNSNSPIAQFFEGKIDKGNVRAELKKCVYDVCQKSGTFHMALNKYYETINERMDIQFGFKFYHPGTSDLISALSNILSQSSYADLPEHLHIPQDFLSQSQLKYASNYKKHGMEELQEYLVLLLYARGVRIEAYKDRLGSDATTVVRDVANTRKEIWNAILKERP